MSLFEQARKKKRKLRLALCGPSGSGKTFSALAVAKGLGGPVALMDTERGSGELYAGNEKLDLDYDVARLRPPYTPRKYCRYIDEAVRCGYSVVIIDSLSHAWMGEGGLLEMADTAAQRLNNNVDAAWRTVRRDEKRLIDVITSAGIHLIATMRTTTTWEIRFDEQSGKARPIRVGVKPQQRQGLEYEFTVVLDMSPDDHLAWPGKDRTSLFRGNHFVPSEATGRLLKEWLESGNPTDGSSGGPLYQGREARRPGRETKTFNAMMKAYARRLGDDYFATIGDLGFKSADNVVNRQDREAVLAALEMQSRPRAA